MQWNTEKQQFSRSNRTLLCDSSSGSYTHTVPAECESSSSFPAMHTLSRLPERHSSVARQPSRLEPMAGRLLRWGDFGLISLMPTSALFAVRWRVQQSQAPLISSWSATSEEDRAFALFSPNSACLKWVCLHYHNIRRLFWCSFCNALRCPRFPVEIEIRLTKYVDVMDLDYEKSIVSRKGAKFSMGCSCKLWRDLRMNWIDIPIFGDHLFVGCLFLCSGASDRLATVRDQPISMQKHVIGLSINAVHCWSNGHQELLLFSLCPTRDQPVCRVAFQTWLS